MANYAPLGMNYCIEQFVVEVASAAKFDLSPKVNTLGAASIEQKRNSVSLGVARKCVLIQFRCDVSPTERKQRRIRS